MKLAARGPIQGAFANLFVAGARGFIDDVILLHETRQRAAVCWHASCRNRPIRNEGFCRDNRMRGTGLGASVACTTARWCTCIPGPKSMVPRGDGDRYGRVMTPGASLVKNPSKSPGRTMFKDRSENFEWSGTLVN